MNGAHYSEHYGLEQMGACMGLEREEYFTQTAMVRPLVSQNDQHML